MNTLFIRISFLLYTVSAYANQKPPLTGKFFYADLSRAEYYGLHYVDMDIGSNG